MVELALTAPSNLKRSATWQDKTQPLRVWALELGIPYSTLYGRIVVRRWSVEQAFTTPLNKRLHGKPERKRSLREILGL